MSSRHSKPTRPASKRQEPLDRIAAALEPADELIPAVGYLRMSSDDQEGSIEQQRAEIEAWAAGKYRIVRWYIDAGKSGSKDQERRTEFRRMILDSGKGEFRAVLCWKTNRFARLDSIEGNETKKTLRANGVFLDTVKDGRIDWDTMEGRIVDTVRAEMDHAYSRGLAADSLRGRLATLEAGFWPNGGIPYGYDRLYVAPDGREVRVKRTEGFRKPEKWLLRLVINEEEARIVRWIFGRWLEADVSQGAITEELNRRGVPSPRTLGRGTGGVWQVQAIRTILTNVAYIGFGYLGAGRSNNRGAFDRAGDIRKAGVCPVIIDPETWETAQAILEERAVKDRRPRQGSGALSGILVCAHCGYNLAAQYWRGTPSYICNTPTLHPGATICKRWKVNEADILPRVCSRLVRIVDGELVKALAAQPPVADRLGDLDMQRQRAAELGRQIEQAAERYLRAPAALMPMLERSLETMRQEMAECEARVRELSTAAGEGAVVNFAKWWETVREKLLLVPLCPDEDTAGEPGLRELASQFWLSFRGSPEAADPAMSATEAIGPLLEPAALRGLLVRLGVKVHCFFDAAKDRKKRTPGPGSAPKWVLTRAVMSWKGGIQEHVLDDGSCRYDQSSIWCLPPGAVELLPPAA